MSALRQSDVERRPELPGVPSRGPIHVAGMARAGTSWVAEMLRAAGGFVHLNEPFNPKRPPGRSPGILNAPVSVGYVYVADHNADVFGPALHDTFRFRYVLSKGWPLLRVRGETLPDDVPGADGTDDGAPLAPVPPLTGRDKEPVR